jgi:CRP-like cAMP-binding protein
MAHDVTDRITLATTPGEPITRRFLLGRGRDEMGDEEKAALEAAVGTVRRYPARHQLVRAGEPLDVSMLLIEGYVARNMDDREGHRQLVSVHVPGDFIDLHAFPLKRLDHDVGTLGPVTVAMFEHRVLADLTASHPRLTRHLWFATLIDAAMHREWIFRLGRLGAEGRLAHFFCELNCRLEMVGLASDGRFELPLTQPDLAEACGLTGVHVNRTLKALREANVLLFRSGAVTILDPKRLAQIAEFEPGYLYGEHR